MNDFLDIVLCRPVGRSRALRALSWVGNTGMGSRGGGGLPTGLGAGCLPLARPDAESANIFGIELGAKSDDGQSLMLRETKKNTLDSRAAPSGSGMSHNLIRACTTVTDVGSNRAYY